MSDAVLSAHDARAMFKLIGEVRELGRDTHAWRSRLTEGLTALCGCRASLACEGLIRAAPKHEDPSAPTCRRAVAMVDEVAAGVSHEQRPAFYDQVFWFDHKTDRTLDGMIPHYGTSFTRARADLVDDETWYRSPVANDRFRPNDCGDFAVSMVVVPLSQQAMSAITIYRTWKDRPLGAREAAILEVVHGELAEDFRRVLRLDVKLTPRARVVLECLARGDSEKEIAAALYLSAHTVHDHVKAIHRAYRVRSRGELLGRLARDSRPAARLVTSA